MLVQARDDEAEPDAAQAEHRVLLVQAAHRGAAASRSCSLALSPAKATLTDSSVRSGRNSCSGGSMQPDGDRQAVHRLEDLHEVAPLQRLKRRPARPACPSSVVGQDQMLDQLAPLAKEHVLGTGQADALGPEAGTARPAVRPVVGVGPDARAAAARRRGT